MMDETTKRPRRRPLALMILVPLLLAGVPLWFLILGPKLRRDHLLEKGIQASGRLIAVDETNTTINRVQQLELTVEFRRRDGVLDTGTFDFAPSQRTQHLYMEGAPVTVAYDPEDPDELTIVEIGTSTPSLHEGHSSSSDAMDSLRHVADSLRAFADSAAREARSRGK